MSNHGYQGGHYDQNGLPTNNPWADQTSQQPHQQQYSQTQQQPYQAYQTPNQPQGQAAQGYQAPPGPPPRRTDTFNEGTLVPESERGEQREAMEQFEMSRSQPESQTDRDVATLQGEFPGIDGSLIAALYSDAQNLGATREMLQELNSQAK